MANKNRENHCDFGAGKDFLEHKKPILYSLVVTNELY